VGGGLTDQAWEQMTLPGLLGGMGLRAARDAEADAAYWATWHDLRFPLALTARALGRPLAGDPTATVAAEAAGRLRVAGVEVAPGVAPRLTEEAKRQVAASPWAADMPAGLELVAPETEAPFEPPTSAAVQPQSRRRLLGIIMRGLDLVRAVRLHEQAEGAKRATLLSAGGPGAGSVWAAMPSDKGAAMDNEHWVMAARARLAILGRPAAACCCALPRAGGQRTCGDELDGDVLHPQLCNAGPAHKRTHRALAHALANQLRGAGADCDFERHEAGWTRLGPRGEIVDGFSDLRVMWPGSARVFRIDVTVRSPHAARYAMARQQVAVAAATAAGEKRKRYGETVDVLPVESYGRLGAEGLALVAELAQEARQWGPLRFGVPVGLPARPLRAAIEGAVLRAQADVALLAAGAQVDRALGWRPRPARRQERQPRTQQPDALWEQRLPPGRPAAGPAAPPLVGRQLGPARADRQPTLDSWLAACRAAAAEAQQSRAVGSSEEGGSVSERSATTTGRPAGEGAP